MRFRECLLVIACVPPVLFYSGALEGAATPCVDNAAVIQAAFSPVSAKHYYVECSVVMDGFHPFMVRLPVERRAAVTERLKDRTAQTLACTAHPRDPARSGLAKKDLIVLTRCQPVRVGEVWTLP